MDFGTDVTLEDLRRRYHAVVFAVGAPADRRLGIPGEDARNSMSATELVAWYNGHPEYIDLAPDLSGETAVVVGVGNVALDVARILAKSVDELRSTDIADHALAALAESNIRNIIVLARRGPVQAKFTSVEIREFGHLATADVVVNPADLELGSASEAALAEDRSAQKNMAILQEFAQNSVTAKPRKVDFRFLVSPVEVLVQDGAVRGLRLEHNRLQATEGGYLNSVGTGRHEEIACDLLLRSVGYRGVPLPDVPFEERWGTIPNQVGRIVVPPEMAVQTGEYVAGWAKRGRPA